MNRKGFSLIEIIVVITIVGILMWITIPSVTSYINKTRRDAFVKLAHTYLNGVKMAAVSKELKCTNDFGLQIFYWGFFHLCSSGILCCNFLFLKYTYWLYIRVIRLCKMSLEMLPLLQFFGILRERLTLILLCFGRITSDVIPY